MADHRLLLAQGIKEICDNAKKEIKKEIKADAVKYTENTLVFKEKALESSILKYSDGFYYYICKIILKELKAKEEVMRETYEKVIAEKRKARHQYLRLYAIFLWNESYSAQDIDNHLQLSKPEIVKLVTRCEKVKNYYESTKDIDMNKLKKIANLNDAELDALVKLIEEQ